MTNRITLDQRMASRHDKYKREDVLSAMRGERLPDHLGYPLAKLCTIRGILHSPAFAEGEASVLHGLNQHPEFTRALNARAIMSNRIPDMNPAERPEELPYCIWYPEVASEDTYRKLSKSYPQMRYQVARSCAVAGYTDLYLELEDILPGVAVAEEALAAGNTAIYDHIVAEPLRYNVFDDYYRRINPKGSRTLYLNGDTCVRSMIDRQKQAFEAPTVEDEDDIFTLFDNEGFKEQMYNITEDQGVAESVPDDDDDDAPGLSTSDLMMDLLTSPLPIDLPAGNKNLLILAAAYYGDVDRYARLRRPKMLRDEIFCIVRGIYHNSLFALWWERQHNPGEGEPFHVAHWKHVQKAITARHIMNNNLSRVIAKKDDQDYLPYLIWYPELAATETYKALAQRIPAMREPCIRAAIYAGWTDLFDELMDLPGVVPNQYLAAEAKASGNQHLLSAIQSRAEDLNISLSLLDLGSRAYEPWKLISVRNSVAMHKWNWFQVRPDESMMSGEFLEQGAVYDGIRVEATRLEMFLMVPEAWRPPGKYPVELDYKGWPPKW